MSTVRTYYLPEPSPWPIFGAVALLAMAIGAAGWVNHASEGPYVVGGGVVLLAVMLIGWFGTVIREGNSRLFNGQVDTSFHLGMAWFIFTEAMVFATLFAALFYLRLYSVPDLASGESASLWPGFRATWPTAGPQFSGSFTRLAAWGVPAINTVVLLSSGAMVSLASSAIARGNLTRFKLQLALVIVLGVAFLCLQASEYHRAFTQLNLNFSTGVYGATFFILTGLHGVHVAIGAVFLAIVLARTFGGQITREHHFAFTAGSWYWHFVGVAWVVLFVLVYCI
jgi:cytochrome c oxidase subunit III